MLRGCPRGLNNAVEVYGLTYFEWVVSLIAFATLVMLYAAWGLLVCWVVPYAMLKIRAGKYRGFFLHAVIALDLDFVCKIPGFVRAREQEFTTW